MPIAVLKFYDNLPVKRTMLKKFSVKSSIRCEFIDVVDDIQQIVYDSGAVSGVCYLYVPHTTAAVTINEGADPSVIRDMNETLCRLVPQDPDYRHMEGNSDAHLKSTLTGVTLSIIIDKGKLVLGTWQTIYFCEYDGPRDRIVCVKIIEG